MTSPSNSDSKRARKQNTHPTAMSVTQSTGGLEEKTSEYFKNEAMKKIEELQVPRKAIIELKSSLALIMERNESDKSYLDKAAEWYAKTAWWHAKAGLILLMSSSGAFVGLTIGAAMAPVFALLAIGIYYAGTFLLMEHYNTTTRRDNRLREHFSEREEAMTDAITLLESAEQHVEAIIIALCELNIKSADKLKSFEDHLSSLSIQTTDYLNAVHKLETATDSIVRDNEIIASHLQAAGIDATKSRPDIEQEPVLLHSVIKSLEEKNAALSGTSDDFVGVSKQMQTNATSLAALVVGFQEQLTVLQRRVIEKKGSSDELSTPMDETLKIRSNTDGLMTESDDAILNAEFALHEFDKYMTGCNHLIHSEVSIHPDQRISSVIEQQSFCIGNSPGTSS